MPHRARRCVTLVGLAGGESTECGRTHTQAPTAELCSPPRRSQGSSRQALRHAQWVSMRRAAHRRISASIIVARHNHLRDWRGTVDVHTSGGCAGGFRGASRRAGCACEWRHCRQPEGPWCRLSTGPSASFPQALLPLPPQQRKRCAGTHVPRLHGTLGGDHTPSHRAP